MHAQVFCVGKGIAAAAIDWTVTAGEGSIAGSPTARTLTDASGAAVVAWTFGATESAQGIEAVFTIGSRTLRAAVAHTVLSPGPNRCDAAGGTDLGSGRTITTSETWTRANSPYVTRCPANTNCAGEVVVADGAALTIEPGAVVCVNRIRARESGRIVAAGTAAEPIHFGVRSRADHWQGLEFETPAGGASMAGPSVLRHAVIENASGIDVAGHPVIIEDTVMRRVLPGSRDDRCTTFSIRQHTVDGVEPSRVSRTVIDGLGQVGGWDWWELCPAVLVRRSASTAPLVLGLRVLNSRGSAVLLHDPGGPITAGPVQFAQCEISGSADGGLLVADGQATWPAPRISSCNIFGNRGMGLLNWGFAPLDARNNWWGDPAGTSGPKADLVSPMVDASSPLAAPVDLGY